jgi:hypothetical protein
MRLNNILILLIVSLLCSCGDQATGGKRSVASTGETFSLEIKSLDANQLNIAYRVCLSFRSKRNNWHMNSVIGKTAKISFEDKSCSEVTPTQVEISPDPVISAPTLSSVITFSSLSAEGYVKEVQTDLHGELKYSCPTVLKNENILEFFVEGQNQRVYTVFEQIDDTTDRVTFKHTIKDSDGEFYTSYKVVSMDVKTSGVETNLIGTVSELTSSIVCKDDPSTHYTRKQTLNSIL